MGKRSITDEEIGLIKAMLSRRMKNRDIQFYFNRQERPVNSGRISQIGGRTYGSEVPTASDDALSQFLADFTPAEVGAIRESAAPNAEPTIGEVALSLFEQKNGGWFLVHHEGEETECKETFCLKPEGRFADPLRSIAGLANNKGGYLFFGVREQQDKTLKVTGLRDETFAETDPADINRCLAGALAPVPKFTKFILDFDGPLVGVIHVEKHEHPPIIAVKNVNTEVKEGGIYYRYVGETRVAKPAEINLIIAKREQRAVAEFARRMSRVAIGSAATLDLDTGKVDGRSGNLFIGEELLPKLQFIREGEFSEQKGTPTLKLIGDVSPVSVGPERKVRHNVTNEAVLMNFLKQERVEHPLQYLLHSAHTGRKWLPLFYYAHSSGLPLDNVVKTLKSEAATHKNTLESAISRLQSGNPSAFQTPTGRARIANEETLNGTLNAPVDTQEVTALALGIQGLKNGSVIDFDWLKTILQSAYRLTEGDSPRVTNARSQVYRAACRLDEMQYEAMARRL
ncbi:ATP-binding protein [Mesorhizobium sp. SB112]|uniref:ATP-binding protein n=1 Tax=Mesorhizobium sp. SB112 TaxID=3151853 RepID=UPI00326790BC